MAPSATPPDTRPAEIAPTDTPPAETAPAEVPTDGTPDPPPPVRPLWRRALPAAVLAGLLAVGVLGAGWQETRFADPTATATAVPDRLAATISQAQDRLRRVPGDAATWAELGAAYVERARATADPGYYPQAEGALAQSMQLQPEGNAPALIGLGALANARHEFAAARGHAEQALVLNPASPAAYGVLADATTQLGDTAAATAAVQRMLDLRPGVVSFTRASYELELHGDTAGARSALQRALDAATSRDEVAFCEYQLGELAWNAGDVAAAAEHYRRGLLVDPTGAALLQGRAKALAAAGDVDAGLEAYRLLTLRVPLPQYLLEYGELLQSTGRDAEAGAQYTLIEKQHALSAATGAADGLAVAALAADHGDPAVAVTAAQTEYAKAASMFSADALAWALHAAGRDSEALPHAEQAAATGRRDAATAYHRGMILAGLGRTAEAVVALESALATNPHFSPLHAPIAAGTLDALRGRS